MTDFWSKWPISDLVSYNVKIPTCSTPLGSTLSLPGSLESGTVWTSISNGTDFLKGQSWTFGITWKVEEVYIQWHTFML